MLKKNPKRSNGRFIAIPYNMFESDAYKTLSSKSMAVLNLFKFRFFGNNNGEIHLTAREIRKEYSFGIGTGHSCLKELEDHGFIKTNEKGMFTTRKATTWILTFETYGEKNPTNEWKNYKKGINQSS